MNVLSRITSQDKILTIIKFINIIVNKSKLFILIHKIILINKFVKLNDVIIGQTGFSIFSQASFDAPLNYFNNKKIIRKRQQFLFLYSPFVCAKERSYFLVNLIYVYYIIQTRPPCISASLKCKDLSDRYCKSLTSDPLVAVIPTRVSGIPLE